MTQTTDPTEPTRRNTPATRAAASAWPARRESRLWVFERWVSLPASDDDELVLA